ncbi:MAG: GGDEF domain-containing protein, partial [Gammaproteobacteria bacterium]
MDLVFALTTLLFGALFVLRQIQYQKIKQYNRKLEEKLADLKDRNEKHSSELSKSNDDLAYQAHDHLTGLPGREAFDDRLAQALHQSKRYQVAMALLALNVDNYQEINRISYEVGDKVLSLLAQRLQFCVRQIDTLTRYAGNSFFILLPQITKPETAAYVAQRIQDNLIQAFQVDNHELFLTVSIGIAVYPGDGETPKELMQHAIAALMIAKTKGKNNYHFYREETHELGKKEIDISTYVRSDDFLNKLLINY